MTPTTPNPGDMPIRSTLDQIKQLVDEYPILGQLSLYDYLHPEAAPAIDEPRDP